ncbi:hypothetical protein ACTSKR_15775 [Chitinibacteraceae bacterium HSL-7]
MYDCQISEDLPIVRTRALRKSLRYGQDRYVRSRLSLAAPAGVHSLQLTRAFAAASSLGFALEQHDDGLIDVLDLGLFEALLFAGRFPYLLIRYEPARPWQR